VAPVLIRFERFTGFHTSGSAGGHDLFEWLNKKAEGNESPGGKALTRRTFLCTLKSEGEPMTTIKATEARARLFKLLDQAAESHEPIQITGKRSNAVLISEEDWRSIQETLYLLSIPGMRESIRKGLKTPVEKCSETPGW
jgi:antitoxin YefM